MLCRHLLFIVLYYSIHISTTPQCRACIVWDIRSLDTLSHIQKQQIIEQADNIIKTPFVSVRNKKKSLTGHPNDYESLATYFWPDPTNPNGRYIVKDGQRNPEIELYCTPLIYALSHKLKYTCEAYYLTNNDKYAQYAKEQLSFWFINSTFRMEPNFEYGQFIPGGEYTKGNIGAISEAYYFIDVLEAIALLKDNKYINKIEDRELKDWFRDFSTWMRTSVIGSKMKTAEDNCSIMFDVLLYRISFYINDKATCREITKNFTTQRLYKQIAEDGKQIMEMKRSKAINYSIYNLNHIIDFYFMIENSGMHYYVINAKRIESALNYLYKIISNNEPFSYTEYGDRNNIKKQLQTLKLRINRLNDMYL